jgi:hypothetical protein
MVTSPAGVKPVIHDVRIESDRKTNNLSKKKHSLLGHFQIALRPGLSRVKEGVPRETSGLMMAKNKNVF